MEMVGSVSEKKSGASNENEEKLIRTHGIMLQRKCVNDGLAWTVATIILFFGALTLGGWTWIVFYAALAWTSACFVQAGVLNIRMNLGTYGKVKHERDFILKKMRNFRHML